MLAIPLFTSYILQVFYLNSCSSPLPLVVLQLFTSNTCNFLLFHVVLHYSLRILAVSFYMCHIIKIYNPKCEINHMKLNEFYLTAHKFRLICLPHYYFKYNESVLLQIKAAYIFLLNCPMTESTNFVSPLLKWIFVL